MPRPIYITLRHNPTEGMGEIIERSYDDSGQEIFLVMFESGNSHYLTRGDIKMVEDGPAEDRLQLQLQTYDGVYHTR